MFFLTVCLNPTVQKTIVVPAFRPGEVNRATVTRIDSAGKGANVGRVIHQLGHDVRHLTQAGGEDGVRFLELCAGDELPVVAVPTSSNARTCTTVIGEADHSTTELVEPTEPVEATCEESVRRAFDDLLPDAHTVVISGSKAPGFSDRIFPGMVAAARAAGRTVLVDYRGGDLIGSLSHAPTLIKPNLAEFVQTFLPDALSGGEIEEEADSDELLDLVSREMIRVHRESGAVVILTRGSRPTLVCAGPAVERVAVKLVTPVNTIGCGDAFAAGLVVALHEGADLTAAVARAHECAAANASLLKPGAIR